MLNPKLQEVEVDNILYGITWFDFGEFIRLDVYKDDKRVFQRRLPRSTDQEFGTIQYVIRKMVKDGISK